jgi:hypothetical protein
MTKPIARDVMYRGHVFEAEVIELCVRWYITYRLSYRDLVEIMAERGIRLPIPQSSDGSSGMSLSTRSDGTASRDPWEPRGEWTRPTVRFAADGTTCIVQSTNMARRSTFSCVEIVGLRPHKPSFAKLSSQ